MRAHVAVASARLLVALPLPGWMPAARAEEASRLVARRMARRSACSPASPERRAARRRHRDQARRGLEDLLAQPRRCRRAAGLRLVGIAKPRRSRRRLGRRPAASTTRAAPRSSTSTTSFCPSDGDAARTRASRSMLALGARLRDLRDDLRARQGQCRSCARAAAARRADVLRGDRRAAAEVPVPQAARSAPTARSPSPPSRSTLLDKPPTLDVNVRAPGRRRPVRRGRHGLVSAGADAGRARAATAASRQARGPAQGRDARRADAALHARRPAGRSRRSTACHRPAIGPPVRDRANGESSMTIKPGDKLPEADFRVMTPDGPVVRTTADVFKGKRVVLFAVPGAFTPTCHNNHLPGFLSHRDEILAKGVDADRGDRRQRRLRHGQLGQGFGRRRADRVPGRRQWRFRQGDRARARPQSPAASALRSQRYSMLVDDGVVTASMSRRSPASTGVVRRGEDSRRPLDQPRCDGCAKTRAVFHLDRSAI